MHALCLRSAWIALALAAPGCWAGSASGQFEVSIVLLKPSLLPPVTPSARFQQALSQVAARRGDSCISESFSQAAQAAVRVTCSTGYFVSIEPLLGLPFLGTHGGAFRFRSGPSDGALRQSTGASPNDVGAAPFKTQQVDMSSGQSEMLVSF
jgi:hypothetical protein